MLAEMEIGWVELFKTSALASRLAEVATLPDEDEDKLVGSLAANAPALYVVAGKNIGIGQGTLDVPFGLACVSRNARGHEDARRGDGTVIGLYQIMEGALALAENAKVAGYTWKVTDAGFLNSEKLWKAGLTVAVITVQATATMPAALEESQLADFKTFHMDMDIKPQETAEERGKWKQEPPDYSSSKPELSDTLIIQP